MSRLIDVQPSLQELPAELIVAVGDILRFSASGGRVRTGSAVELLGVFNDSVLGTDGRVLAPLGVPGTVLFAARRPGRAAIDLVIGDLSGSSTTKSVVVSVEP